MQIHRTGPPRHRVVMIGDAAVGKSSILNRLIRRSYEPSHQPTIGAAYEQHVEQVGQECVHMRIWDTGGQERYKSLGPVYYRDAVAAIAVFDLTKADSFTSLDAWIRAFEDVVPTSWAIMVLGNKSDLGDRVQVSDEQVRQWIGGRVDRITYIKTSALTGEGVAEAFHTVAHLIHQRKKAAVQTEPIRMEQTDKKDPLPQCC